MKDSWINLVLLLLFVLVPVISALGKMIKDQLDKAKAENERSLDGLGKVRKPLSFDAPRRKTYSEGLAESAAAEAAAPTLPEEETAYETVAEHMRTHPLEHVTESVRHDIEEQVVKDLDSGRWEHVGEGFGFEPHIGTDPDGKKRKASGSPGVLPARLNQAVLRRAFVMAELLGPPLALKDREEEMEHF